MGQDVLQYSLDDSCGVGRNFGSVRAVGFKLLR